ncbi:protein kinase [Pantoea sp. EA-12]|uniref:serine/threonine protein kinase n=1 Tax=Pantoea sp. EA-12 TaxID=3043303 RepID=UPI0024B57849|nr:protein kinase [Pantoea sp. EA-12]MDI9221524.1 protein kinase [Pantoea sp. EA-12]
MDIPDLIKQLKAAKVITTLVGEFTFRQQIGEGGNSNVCLYVKEGKEFAVKFFSKGTENRSKTDRFIDEFFGMAQIPSHPCIAEYFHLDTVTISDEKFLIIIMRRYASALRGTLSGEADETLYVEKMTALFEHLLDAIGHLHAHGIIHRDIKPQNILIDRLNNRFVLSDFGISKFDPEYVAREAETEEGERLANYRYCAPEQRGHSIPASFSSDLYSLAQVMQEYATGDINQGGGRTPVRFQNSETLRIIDRVIAKCLMHNPAERLQSVPEVRTFMHTESEAFKADILYRAQEKEISEKWAFLFAFSNAIAKGCPAVRQVGEITDPGKIRQFLEYVDATLAIDSGKEMLWMVKSNGGDQNYYGAEHIRGHEYEINFGGFAHQANIFKILVHYDSGRPYRNFFVILTGSLPPFEYTDCSDLTVKKCRPHLPHLTDEAVQWNGLFLDPADTENPYVEIEGTVHQYDRATFRHLSRFIAPEALFVSPEGVADYRVISQNQLAERLLRSCIAQKTLSSASVRQYWNGIGGRLAHWISSRN